MVATVGGFIIDPNGATLVVDVLTAGGARPVAYTAVNGSSTHSLPVTITTRTAFHFATPLLLRVSAKLNDTEIAAREGTTATVDVQQGSVTVLTPGVDSPAEYGAYSAAQSGTSAPGTPTVRAFPFAYNTAGLLTGAALYTPTIDDWLLDAWITVETAWDGTTPIGDFGALIGGDITGFLLYSGLSNGQDMTVADVSDGSGRWPHGYRINKGAKMGLVTLQASTASTANRLMPVQFATADPVKVVVSQDGTAGGADPGATMGAATLYLITATPA